MRKLLRYTWLAGAVLTGYSCWLGAARNGVDTTLVFLGYLVCCGGIVLFVEVLAPRALGPDDPDS